MGAGLILAVDGLTISLTMAGLGVAAWTVFAFNRMIRDRNLMREAWSGVDVQLRASGGMRRASPNAYYPFTATLSCTRTAG